MNLVPFGRTDLRVANLCLGTMQFGWTADEAASFEVMDAYTAAAGNFIDTADIYSRWAPGNPGGVSEEIIGRWLQARGNRGQLVIATKVRGQMWDGADGDGLSRAHITRACEDSLRRLQIETIDLYQAHYPDDNTKLEETLRAWGDLVQAGKVRYIGLSNYWEPGLRRALQLAAEKALPRIVSLQPHYSLVHRKEYEHNCAAVCEAEGIAVIPYSPLAGGFLTGKYRRGQPHPRSARLQGVKEYMTDQGWAVLEAAERIAQAHSTTIPAVALAWLLARPALTAPIIGANSPAQLADLLPGSDLVLAPDEFAELDRLSQGM